MAEARQMSLFGVDRSHEEKMDRLYNILLSNLGKWRPGKYDEDKPGRIQGPEVHVSIRDVPAAGRRRELHFSERRALMKRLDAEGRCPTVWEEERHD